MRSGSNLPIVGTFRVDTVDVTTLEAGGQLFDTVLHEMGHILGIGSIWTNLSLITGAGSSDPRFTGTGATAEYNSIFGLSKPSVPVENTGGGGTADVHFRETTFANELMTGFIDATNPLSRLTIAMLQDLGYSAAKSVADAYAPPSPFPPAAALRPSGSGGGGSGGLNFGPGDTDDFVPVIAIPNGQLFDFGTANSVLAQGYNRVSPSTTYSAAQGFGWLPAAAITAADLPATGTNDLTRDFNAAHDATFAVDLPNGIYDVYVTVGDNAASHDQQKILLEGDHRSNISTTPGQFISNTYRVIVKDGQLTLRITGNGTAAINSLAVNLVTLGDFGTPGPTADATGRFAFAIENLNTGFVMRGSRDLASGGPLCPDGIFFAPNTTYRQWVLNIDTLETGVSEFTTPPSGQNFDMPFIIMGSNTGPDSDSDGLFDQAEFILGTKPGSADSDGDGINDLAEIQNGLDPLSGLSFPTGIVASLPLQGDAQEVVVKGSTLNAEGRIAYVATGAFGLAIVDATDFKVPIVRSQLDLAGDATDVDVDPRLNIAAVATGASGLVIVDVANPSSPQLVRTIAGNTTQIEVFEGVAYVNQGGDLRAYDLLTGERQQSLPLNGGNITGIAREGSTLYTMDSARILRAVDLSTGLMVAQGTLTMPAGGGKLFVGNGIAYVATELSFTGGFATADVTNPNSLVLLSDVDNTSIAGKAVAANGSGLLVSVGNPGGAIGTRSLDVSNVTDPANTGGFQGTSVCRRFRAVWPSVPDWRSSPTARVDWCSSTTCRSTTWEWRRRSRSIRRRSTWIRACPACRLSKARRSRCRYR